MSGEASQGFTMTTELLVAVVSLRVAYLAVGLGLCWIGRSLIERGVSADFKGEGAVARFRFKVVTASPGLVFGVAGLVVIGLAIFRQAQVPLGPLSTASTARFAADSPVAKIETALHEGHPQQAAAELLGLWRSDPLKVGASLDEPELRPVIEAAIQLALERPQLTAKPETLSVTLESVRARLWMTLQATPALQTRTGEVGGQLAELDVARRKGDATTAARLLVAVFNRNPKELLRILEGTQSGDWPADPGTFMPLREALIRAAAP